MKKLNRWVYAVVGIFVLLLAGLVYAWSVMSKPIGASRPAWSVAQLSLTFTIVMVCFCLGCLIAGLLAKRVSPKVYVRLSGVLFLAGFFIASLTGETPALLYVGFGVLCGFGAGLSYNAVMSTMSLWFPDKQGLISGILLMGFGFSSFIIGKVFATVTPSDGSDRWQNTFCVLGIVIVIVMVLCSFFFVKPEAGYRPAGMQEMGKKAVREPAMEVSTGQMMKIPSFWMYYIWAIVVSAAGLVLVSQAGGIAGQVGSAVSDSTIATVVGLISIFNGIGRVVFGALFDRRGYRLTMILVMALFVITAGILILSLTGGSFVLIIVGFMVGGFAYGGVTPTNSALISDFYGRQNFSMNFSVINTNLILASFASTVAGKLYDSTQSYLATIFLMVGVTAAGFVIFFGVRRPKG